MSERRGQGIGGSQEERRTRGLDVLRTLRGGGKEREAAASLETENGALGSFIMDHALAKVWARPGLSRRDRSLIVVAVLGALGQPNQLRAHVNGALNHGLSPEEVREIATHVAGYAGFPRGLEAMKVVNEVIAERLGDQAPPIMPAEAKDDARRRADGAKVFAKLTGRDANVDPDEMCAVMEQQLGALGTAAIEFAFGDIWARPQLPLRDRSLLIVAVLTALGRSEELAFHVPGAFRNGLSFAELEEVMLMMTVYAGFPFGVGGMRALKAHAPAEAQAG